MSMPEFGRILEQEPSSASFGRILEQEPEERILEKSTKLAEKGADIVNRIPSQLSMRGLEHIIGAPREFGEFLEGLVPKKTLIKGAEKVGLGKGAENLINFSEKYAPYKLFPTVHQTRDFTKKLFGDLFEPKNKWEERAGEAFGEFASMAIPFLGKIPIKRAALTSTFANTSKAISDDLGFNPKWGKSLKAGTYIFGALVHPKAGEDFYRKNYDLAEQVLPQNATYSSVPLGSKFSNLKKNFTKSGISSADAPALKQIENIEKEFQGAQVPIDALVTAKRKINIERGNLYKQLEGNKPGIKTAKHNLDQVANAIDDTLDLYGKTDPNWKKYYDNAQSAFAAVEGSKRFGNMVSRNFSKFIVSHLGLSALLGHFAGIKATGGVTAAAYPAYKAIQTMAQIMKSKPLRQEFFKLYRQALSGNVKGMEKSVNKLDKDLPEKE
jgi:hypothetical protein